LIKKQIGLEQLILYTKYINICIWSLTKYIL
jgi:hypothetical protein